MLTLEGKCTTITQDSDGYRYYFEFSIPEQITGMRGDTIMTLYEASRGPLPDYVVGLRCDLVLTPVPEPGSQTVAEI